MPFSVKLVADKGYRFDRNIKNFIDAIVLAAAVIW